MRAPKKVVRIAPTCGGGQKNDQENGRCAQRTGNGFTLLEPMFHLEEAGSEGGNVGRCRLQGTLNVIPRYLVLGHAL